MIDTTDGRHYNEDQKADQNSESEQDCSSDEFQDVDHFPDEEEDNFDG